MIALFRVVCISSRFHGFTIYNEFQRGAIPNYLFALAPERFIHSCGKVNLDGRWINLEGHIIDKDFLDQVQKSLVDQCKEFSFFGLPQNV